MRRVVFEEMGVVDIQMEIKEDIFEGKTFFFFFFQNEYVRSLKYLITEVL